MFKKFFTSNIPFNDSISYRRLLMMNSMLFFAVAVFVMFAGINLFLRENYTIAILDIIAALFSTITLIHLRRHYRVKVTALISVLFLMLFMFSFIIENKNSHFGIIWSYFIPMLAIHFNGKKVGLGLSIGYLTVIFTFAYMGIGEWNNGAWEYIDFFRFSISSFVFTIMIYLIESAHDSTEDELEKIRLHEAEILTQLQKQAITDPLTGIYNRRYFNEKVPELLAIAEKEGCYLSFFILDIDYFKNYNDTYGHQKGDEIIKHIADAVVAFQEMEYDFVFRIGGEEFAGVLISTNITESEKRVALLNAKIEACNIEHTTSLLPQKRVTASIGVCSAKVTEDKDMNYFYKRADSALYKAKEKGRNRTVFYAE